MCTVDKMLIKGIRSFSQENGYVIEFYRPLTLIVGHNGAGKTTIIECLKMATTGDLPPNTRSGQSFIHDPKVAGETEVKAQIKLRFRTATGSPVVVMRSFQLTQKKLKNEFKALEQTIQTHDKGNNEKKATSYRCADIDRLVPSLMGVSKAVLENVIFVHQEESNWPLAEGQILKKKFDDIFSATKYTKALEALRKLRSENMQEVKEMKLKLDHLKTLKDTATNLRTEQMDGQKRVGELNLEIESIGKEAQAKQDARSRINRDLTKIADIMDEYRNLEAQHASTARHNAETSARLTGAYGRETVGASLEDLQEWVSVVDPTLSNSIVDSRRAEREISTKSLELEAIRVEHSRDTKLQSRLVAEADAHERNLIDRSNFVRRLSAQQQFIQLTAGDGTLPLATIDAFVKAFSERLQQAESEMQAMRDGHRGADDQIASLVDGANAELSRHTEGLRLKQELITANLRKVEALERQIGGLAVDQALLDDMQRQERDLAAALQAKQDAAARATFEATMQRESDALASVNTRMADLRQERDRLSAANESAVRIRDKTNEANRKKAELDALLNSRRQNIASVLGQPGQEPPPLEQLRDQLQTAVAAKENDLKQRSARVQSLQNKASQADGTLAHLRQTLQQRRDEASGKATELSAGIQRIQKTQAPEQIDLPRELKAAEAQRLDKLKVQARLTTNKAHIEHQIETAQAEGQCAVCERPFADAAETQAFLDKQEETLRKLPTVIAATEKALADVSEQLRKLQLLEPLQSEVARLQQQAIPDLERRIAALQNDLDANRPELQRACGECDIITREIQEGNGLLMDVVRPAGRLDAEVRSLRAEIAQLTSSRHAVGAGRTVQDVDAELEQAEMQRVQHEHLRNVAMRKDRQQRDELTDLMNQYNAARDNTNSTAAAAQQRRALEHQRSELLASVQQAEQEIAQGAQAKAPIEEKRNQLLKEREDKRIAARKQERDAEHILHELSDARMQLNAKQRGIDDYEHAGKAVALERVNASVEELTGKLEELERQMKSLEEAKRDSDTKQREDAAYKRQLEDCIALRKAIMLEENLAQQMDSKLAELTTMQDRQLLVVELNTAERELREFERRQDMSRGALGTIQANVERATDGLAVVQLQGIDQKHKGQLIALKTTEMAVSDLDKFHKALEKALLVFHTTKMADINKIIKELWQQTYRNQDIDYIQIKADADSTRSYNYRVVMYCGGAELEMRGRCSAGQKVLACLIIRLALAETFCLNCGILALDEPTTNLDADNSASLADALRNIMIARQGQENFQLIVITHDERFAQIIGTREHAESLWRVTKDDNQHSKLSREPIMA